MPSHYTPERTDLAAGLYLVATPIGNLGDMTMRALSVLASVDVIACEDTRVSKRLLHHYGIQAATEAYHEHNAAKMRPRLLEILKQNGRIALISDAGTPLISDPGYKLVREAIDADIRIVPVPGASSVMAALCMAGLPTDKFMFLGFLPTGEKDTQTLLRTCQHLPASLVMFSTPGKLEKHIQLCIETLGDRPVALCREITKIYEEAWRGTLGGLLCALAEGLEPRGEIVLVISGHTGGATVDAETIDRAILEHLARMPLKSAASEVASLFGIPKNQTYQRALQLQKQCGQ